MIVFQAFAAFFIWIISVMGGASAFYLYRQQHVRLDILQIAEAFAGGIFLGAALFHMLPDAAQALTQAYPAIQYPFANLICAGGFCVLLFLEQLVGHFQHVKQQHSLNLIPLLLTLLISIHALSEGIALGINQQLANMLIIFVAIAVHKSSEGFAVGIQLKSGTLSNKTLIAVFLLFSLMSPLGITIGMFTREIVHGKISELLLGIFNAFAAGTFLYIATLHKLHHRHHSHSQLKEFWATLIGLSLMASVAIWL